jgi:hypothetical protein
MNWIEKIKLQLTHPPKSKYLIKEAFTCGGIQYYQFDDIFNVPYQRGLTAVTFFREMQMNCDREFLLAHCDAKANIAQKIMDGLSIKNGKLDLNKAISLFNQSAQLDLQLKERVTMITDPDLIYKLASVVFFDKSESPTHYEHGYNLKKIEHWKKHSSMYDFFLQMPLIELVPFLKPSDNATHSYLEMITSMQMTSETLKKSWDGVLSHLSQERRMKLDGK